MNKAYNRIIWQNQPSTATALGATNLNKMDNAINTIDDRVVSMDTAKANQSTVNDTVKSITYNEKNGVLTITKVNGTSTTIDTKLEKLAVNFSYDPITQKLIITLDDGTKQEVDLSSLISQYEFVNTSTVAFVIEDGKVKANVVNGSITADKLQPNYLADITVQAQTATAQANKSKRYAVGGVETGDTTDNAKYYKEQAELFKNQAKTFRDEAEDISGVGVATDAKLGLVNGNGNVEVRTTGDMWADPYKDKATNLEGKFITCNTADNGVAPVKKIVGETQQVITIIGKNKFPIIKTQTKNGITLTSSIDGTLTLNGTVTGTSTIYFNTPISLTLMSGTSYKWTANNPVANSNVELQLSKNEIGGIHEGWFLNLGSIGANMGTSPSTISTPLYATVSVKPSQTLTNFIIKPQFEIGTTATTYEPFTPNSPSPEYPSPLLYAKDFDIVTSPYKQNLVRYSKTMQRNQYVAYSPDKVTVTTGTDGFVIAKLLSLGEYVPLSFLFTDYKVSDIEGKQVTISAMVKSDKLKSNPNYYQISTGVFDTNNERCRYLGIGGFEQPKYNIADYKDGEWVQLKITATLPLVKDMTVTTERAYVKFGVQFYSNPTNTTAPLEIKQVKMEFGDNLTPKWTPSPKDIALCVVEDNVYRKSISFPFMGLPNGTKNGKEYVNGIYNDVLRVKEDIFNGIEAWDIGEITSNFIRFRRTDMTNIKKDNTRDSGNILCDKFKAYSQNEIGSSSIINGISTHSTNGVQIKIDINELQSPNVAGFKLWLSQNPIKVQYELENHTNTPIDPIYLKSYKGTTNLFTNSSPQVAVTADFKSELWSNEYLLKQSIENVELPDNLLYYTEESVVTTPIPRDADTLGGKDKAYYEGLVSTIDAKFASMISKYEPNISNTAIISESALTNYTSEGNYSVYLNSVSGNTFGQGRVYLLEVRKVYYSVNSSLGIMQRMTEVYPNTANTVTRVYYSYGEWGGWSDTGWQNVALATSFETYTTGSDLRCRKIGNIVHVRGAVKPKSELAVGQSTVITKLPTGYAPSLISYIGVAQGTSMNRWTLSVNTYGDISVSRYGTTNDIAIPAGTWLPIDISYALG